MRAAILVCAQPQYSATLSAASLHVTGARGWGRTQRERATAVARLDLPRRCTPIPHDAERSAARERAVRAARKIRAVWHLVLLFADRGETAVQRRWARQPSSWLATLWRGFSRGEARLLPYEPRIPALVLALPFRRMCECARIPRCVSPAVGTCRPQRKVLNGVLAILVVWVVR